MVDTSFAFLRIRTDNSSFPLCVFYEPEINQNEDYYGPPLFDIEPDDNDYDPDVNQNEDVYGPPAFDLEPYDDDYDPEANYQPTLYGPPPFDMDEDNYGPVDVEE